MVEKSWQLPIIRCLVALASVGCSRVSCSPPKPTTAVLRDAGQPVAVVTINAPTPAGAQPPWLDSVRKRLWSDAVSELTRLDPKTQSEPRIRLVLAYALAKDGKFEEALPLLTELEKELPLLRTQILRLRAEVSVHTNQAVSGAALLSTQGEHRGYVTAAHTYFIAHRYDLALACAKRAVDLYSNPRDDTSRTALAQAKAIRAQVLEARGDASLAAQDWSWLALQAPLQPAASGADQAWEIATGQKLSSDQRMARALAFAKAGMLEATERELEQLQAVSHSPLAPGYSDWLLGKARSRAHVEHAEGAHMLERSVVAHVEDADSIRLEAARLYMRAGQEPSSLRILDTLVRNKSPRSREAQALAARAHGIMGDYAAALRIYDSLLGNDKPKGKNELAFEQSVTALLAGQPARAMAALDILVQSEPRESLRARTAELAAVAALEANRKDDAQARFRAVITQYPFTLGAWLATVRLKQLDATSSTSPIPANSPPAPRTFSLEIPKAVAILHELGIDEWASKALFEQEAALRSRYGAAAGEFLCDTYDLLGVAERRFAWSREAVGNLDLSKLPDASARWRWDCRYPRPYPSIVNAMDRRWQLPPGLLYAVMRQESNFRERIQSAVGATGLTQLMPNTARRVIEEFGAVPTCAQADALPLDEPRCNIEIGARYLHKLLEAFDGQLPLVVLSYNAGPQVVSHWAPDKQSMPLDLFLAKVPFAETRNYVHHVLTNFLVYSWLLQPQSPLPSLRWTPTHTNTDRAALY